MDKVKSFKEIHRILKNGGRMVVPDLVSDRRISRESIDLEKWSSCIEGTLTKEDYIATIRKAGFQNISVLEERPSMEQTFFDYLSIQICSYAIGIYYSICCFVLEEEDKI